MDFEKLKMFCKVVEEGSFQKAAESEFVSQRAVSQMMKKLEDESKQLFGIDISGYVMDRKVMDAENPEFPDGSFDMIISRNLTWTLPHVRHAYGEWIRVLKKGGILLNFDANYGITDFSNVEDLPENHAHNMLGNEMMRECEEIKRQLPISSYSRPAWDLETLGAMSLKEFHVDLGISSRIYLEKDEFYNPTPLFMLRTVK